MRPSPRGDVEEAVAHLHPDVEWIEPDIVVVHHLHGRLADGTPRTATVADVFTFRDGVVVRTQAYADPADVPVAGP